MGVLGICGSIKGPQKPNKITYYCLRHYTVQPVAKTCNKFSDQQIRSVEVKMYHTSASPAVAVQYKARVTRTTVCPLQIVAQLLTVVFSSTTFVNV